MGITFQREQSHTPQECFHVHLMIENLGKVPGVSYMPSDLFPWRAINLKLIVGMSAEVFLS